MELTFPVPNHQDHLDDLAVMAKAVARRLHDRIVREELYVEETVKLVEAFNDAARTVRRTILLAEHLASGIFFKNQKRTQARRFVAKSVDDAIQNRGDTGPDRKRETARLRDELVDRIDTLDFERDMDTAELDALVETLKADLRLPTARASSVKTPATPVEPETPPEPMARTAATILPDPVPRPETVPGTQTDTTGDPALGHTTTTPPAPSG